MPQRFVNCFVLAIARCSMERRYLHRRWPNHPPTCLLRLPKTTDGLIRGSICHEPTLNGTQKNFLPVHNCQLLVPHHMLQKHRRTNRMAGAFNPSPTNRSCSRGFVRCNNISDVTRIAIITCSTDSTSQLNPAPEINRTSRRCRPTVNRRNWLLCLDRWALHHIPRRHATRPLTLGTRTRSAPQFVP